MKGKCLCGSVSITMPDTNQVHVCHCANCRRQTTTSLFEVSSDTGITVEGTEFVQSYQSSEWLERCFCKKCGTTLFSHLLGSESYFVSAGIFEDTDFHLASQIFIDKKPAYYDLANDTPKITEAEFLAKWTNA